MSPYCLITPDAVADGLVGEIVATFTSERLGILSLEYVSIDAARMLRLYGGESYAIPSPHGPPARIQSSAVDRVFDQAPGVLVDFEPAPGVIERVLRIKGATDPFDAEPSSVRRLGRDALFNGLHSPDDEASAELERDILSSTKPCAMSAAELMQFVELEVLAAHCRSLDLETTLLRVLLRQQAGAICHQTAPVLDIGIPTGLEPLSQELMAARQAIDRRALFEAWLQEASTAAMATPLVLSVLEAIDQNPNAPGMVGVICRQDRDLLAIGLAVERRRAETNERPSRLLGR